MTTPPAEARNPHARRQLPKPAELAPLLRLRRPTLNPVDRRLARATDIWELRAAAQRAAPKAVFDYVDGAAEEELTLSRIRQEYRAIEFRPRVLRDVSMIDPSTTLLGSPASLPLAFAPTGYTRMMHHEGEIAVGRAAQRLGIPYGLSTVGTTTPEDLRASCPDASLWFQLYVWKDRAETKRLVERARDRGYTALLFTVDTPIAGNRQRDTRNGLTIPPELTLRTIAGMATRPAWWINKLTTPTMGFACVPEAWGSDEVDMAGNMFDPAVTYEDLEWLRTIWPGTLVVKGVQTIEDAKESVARGADAIVLSNHGGRQLDRTSSVLRLLPEVVRELGNDAEVLIDSGILRGADVVAAVALGARGVLVGRAYLYGLMAGGERGVQRAGELLEQEIRTCMALLGARTVDDLTPDLVRLA
ncbi:lactate dehydrogenase [Intrasporangium chromatireducens Q5-1]|uniref:Lactate dehydrogenase n=1 Tax=Intrasporangium chromatireducens Q5-1 TaxID=584657 RepID=W9GJW8_9MICO|nr:alpha-hydroxy acid oxidase [Intrasporangium chromatireducens]EWT06516.1 lactate dehydrogenase [Intrasporangium chromatireducens Q5-1]